MGPEPVRVVFWGVRGSVPGSLSPGALTGGNTPCVEIRTPGGRPVIIDAGTGLRPLGVDLMARAGIGGLPGRVPADVSSPSSPDHTAWLLLSHFHWDHIQGIPFFAPMYEWDWNLSFFGARPPDEINSAVTMQMSPPYFSAHDAIHAEMSFEEIRADGVEVDGVSIHAFRLNHPGGSVGFRVEVGGRTVVYASDHEHGDAEVDRDVRERARGADLLIWDSTYTPEDYDSHRGWGHSTWLEGTQVAAEAGVDRLVLFHHEPARRDDEVKRIEDAARRRFENTVAAREGLALSLA